jgi:hypothetical protein
MTITDKQIDVIAYRLQNGMNIHEALAILPNTKPLCKNCKFFDYHKDSPLLKNGFGYCINPVLKQYIDDELDGGIGSPISGEFGCRFFEVKDGKEN